MSFRGLLLLFLRAMSQHSLKRKRKEGCRLKSKIVNRFSFFILLIILSVFFSLKVDANIGDFLFKWGIQGSGDGQFEKPRDVALDGIGDVYVAEQDNDRIQVFDSTGSFKDKWGSSGSGDGEFNFNNYLILVIIPCSIAIDNKPETNIIRIRVY